jgi:hypothetical protein
MPSKICSIFRLATGFNYLLTQRAQLCLSTMLPNPRSGNSARIVFELNLLGYDDEEEEAR